MRRALPWGILACALALAATTDARASDDKATREALTRFREGISRVKAGDFEAARRSFAQAYAVIHKPDILWNLALAEQKSGHTLDALAHFRELQRDFPPGGADRADAGKHLSELIAATGHIEISAPPGAQVSVDGASQGASPLPAPVDVLPGHHHVEVRTASGGPKTADTDASAGQVTRVSFAAPEPKPPPPVAGPEPQSPGLAASPAESPPATPAESSTFWDARGVTVVTLAGLAVAAGGMGLAFGIVSNNDAGTASTLGKQNPDCAGSTSAGCQQLASTVQSTHSAYVTSEALWITGGALAVVAVGTFLVWPRSSGSPSSGLTVVPAFGPGVAGAAASGAF